MLKPTFKGMLWLVGTAALAFSQTASKTYTQHNFVADIPGVADRVDPNLVDPWGMSFSATSPYWISNRGTGTTTLYNGFGEIAPVAAPIIVTIPRPLSATGAGHSHPTGQVQNPVAGFAIATGRNSSFIFCTEDGTIAGWNSAVLPTTAVTVVDKSASGAVYKGMALFNNTTTPASSLIYAANFGNGTVDVFDVNFAPTTVAGGFKDPNLPAGYAPFNVANIGGKLYVTYALQNSAKNHDTPGAGNGYVDIFDTNGNLLQRLASQGTLNSPWGVAIAPSTFGAYANNVLVGNFGDGTINAFDATSGAYQGQLQNASGTALVISGLWAIAVGNTGAGSDPASIYFTAGPSGEIHGLFGIISSAATLAAPTLSANGLVNGASFAVATAANGSVAPGSMASLFGANLSSVLMLAPSVPLPTSLGDTTAVAINGVNAPIFFSSNKQINIQIPFELAPGTFNVTLTRGGLTTAALPVTIVAASPGIFTTGQTGAGQGAILTSGYQLANATTPAGAGDIVQVFCTGLGATITALGSGKATPIIGNYQTNLPVTATIGGVAANVQFAGLAPGYVSLYQVNVVVPAGVTAGTAVPLVLTVNGVSSNSVTLATK